MPFHIRAATQADVPALAALHVQTFTETHRGGRDGGPSYALRADQWRQTFADTTGNWFCLLVEDDRGELVGFAKGIPHVGGVPGFAGEVNKLYLLRRVQRQGLGRQLLCSVARQFLEQGMSSIVLFGEATSPSNRFYEALGAERLYAPNGEFHGGYGWRDVETLLALCGTA